MSISFITLTNSGYIDFTLNCIESLKKIGCTTELTSYCIGKDGYNILKSKGHKAILIDEEENNNFQIFRTGNWSNIVYHKFEIIHANLLNHNFVCFTDGDIVYERQDFMKYLLENMGDLEMLIQNESMCNNIDKNDVCSGFMFIRSTPNTIELFDPINVEKFRNRVGWGDQMYINDIKTKLKFKPLESELFPNGNYFYKNYKNITPYLIHFNWILGNHKKQKMIDYNKWLLPEPNITEEILQEHT